MKCVLGLLMMKENQFIEMLWSHYSLGNNHEWGWSGIFWWGWCPKKLFLKKFSVIMCCRDQWKGWIPEANTGFGRTGWLLSRCGPSKTGNGKGWVGHVGPRENIPGKLRTRSLGGGRRAGGSILIWGVAYEDDRGGSCGIGKSKLGIGLRHEEGGSGDSRSPTTLIRLGIGIFSLSLKEEIKSP